MVSLYSLEVRNFHKTMKYEIKLEILKVCIAVIMREDLLYHANSKTKYVSRYVGTGQWLSGNQIDPISSSLVQPVIKLVIKFLVFDMRMRFFQ